MSTPSTYEGEGPKCPYCGRQYTADEPGYFEPRYVEETCDECGKTFDVEVITDVHWRCSAPTPSPNTKGPGL